MNLKYYYWYFNKIIPERICDEILKLGLSRQHRIATTGEIKEESLRGMSKEAKTQLKALKKYLNALSLIKTDWSLSLYSSMILPRFL